MAHNSGRQVTDRQILRTTLLDLLDPDLEIFVDQLNDDYPEIPKSTVVGASRPKIAEVIVETFPNDAIGTTIRTLRAMGKNNLANRLSRESGLGFD